MYDRFNPRHIYSYPIVEYIPLAVETVLMEKTSRGGPVILEPFTSLEELDRITGRLNLDRPVPNPFDLQDKTGLLTLNYRASLANYRSHNVTLVGTANPGTWHLFTLPSRFFYKNVLLFTAYDLKGKALASARLVFPS